MVNALLTIYTGGQSDDQGQFTVAPEVSIGGRLRLISDSAVLQRLQ